MWIPKRNCLLNFLINSFWCYYRWTGSKMSLIWLSLLQEPRAVMFVIWLFGKRSESSRGKNSAISGVTRLSRQPSKSNFVTLLKASRFFSRLILILAAFSKGVSPSETSSHSQVVKQSLIFGQARTRLSESSIFLKSSNVVGIWMGEMGYLASLNSCPHRLEKMKRIRQWVLC